MGIVCESLICECDLITALNLHFLICACTDIIDVCAVTAVLVDNVSASASVYDNGMRTSNCSIIGNAIIHSSSFASDYKSLFIDVDLLTRADSGQCAEICTQDSRFIASAAQNGCIFSSAKYACACSAGISRISSMP